MIRAVEVRQAGSWTGAANDYVELDYDSRHRRRIVMTGEAGLSFLLDLPKAVVLRGGDGLLLEDGRIVEVRAAAEPLMQVTADDVHHLLRLAWHLGNRHLPAQIETDRILIRPDHVISEMLIGLGANVADVTEPFDPEGGAYAGGDHAGHGHAEHHNHD